MRTYLAISKRKYLNLILAGRKQIECRLTKIACAPYGQIAAGEPILLKESSGPVRGQARAGEVRFFTDLTADQIERIRLDYNDGILGEDDFWETHADCRYATLITLEAVQRIEPPYRIDRKGVRAWIVCAEQSQDETWAWAICLRASAAS